MLIISVGMEQAMAARQTMFTCNARITVQVRTDTITPAAPQPERPWLFQPAVFQAYRPIDRPTVRTTDKMIISRLQKILKRQQTSDFPKWFNASPLIPRVVMEPL